MNRNSFKDDSSLFLDKQIKKVNTVKLEMKGLFLTRVFQNLTMMSTQELEFIDSFYNGPELVKLCLKKNKCKSILSGTRKLRSINEGLSAKKKKKMIDSKVFLLKIRFILKKKPVFQSFCWILLKKKPLIREKNSER